ncbi:hypothetical protein GQ54DRAFT_322671 [Martensiomyces pterosporus]|nr:hypothetical protein GQ54DRAFT_322671 [Martensiomyces pterosporus]
MSPLSIPRCFLALYKELHTPHATMNPDSVTPRIRPFAFKPNGIDLPRSIRPLNLGAAASPAPLQHQRQRGTGGWQSGGVIQPASPHNKKGHSQHQAWSKRQNTNDTRNQKLPQLQKGQQQDQPAYYPQLSLSSGRTAAGGGGSDALSVDKSYTKRSHKDVEAMPGILPPTQKRPKAPPCHEPDEFSLDSKSVIIRDSSDDDLVAELEFPDDILHISRGSSKTAQSSRLESRQPSPAAPVEHEFDTDLDPEEAIKAIKERYQSAIEQVVATEIQHKEALAAQWERTKKDSQRLLNSVKTSIASVE